MNTNNIKSNVAQGRTSVGVFISSGAPSIVETVGVSGYDFVIIDSEHGSTDVGVVEHLIRAAETVNVTPLVRIADISRTNILRVLDLGAMGILVPMLETAEQAMDAVAYSKYPPFWPNGRRGVAFRRAGRYGDINAVDFFKWANDQCIVAIQIETRAGMENLSEILKVDGIDLVFIGPSDLSQSLGYPGNANHPDVKAAVRSIAEASMKAGKIAAVMPTSPGDVEEYLRMGVQCILSGNEYALIRKSATEFVRSVRG
ncbi:MAG TPA: 4-hydroxy-2-oxovalerate aldolase [Firmicutes bacterium]|nr:4-hydroxy-2-oxovalerate aldolase [Bacillota bacterium]